MLAVRAKLSDNDGLTADYCNNGIISKDGWCTRAWFELAAGEDKYVLDTGNRYIYFYAYTTDSEIVWRGHGDEPWCDTSSGEPCTSISLSSTCQQFREVWAARRLVFLTRDAAWCMGMLPAAPAAALHCTALLSIHEVTSPPLRRAVQSRWCRRTLARTAWTPTPFR